MSRPCPFYEGERVDEGPRCCDLSCLMEGPSPLRWEGDDS